ncbi:hypothetical protein [Streptacidiphilus jiangxiensis]|uniref:Uncharacterized protein n=2 Tax=Streptacidiphilus jiangxiensis TaxID=235985 RepID=A0A1H7TR96_STRJI|nr:hypothetical protein [Streptacidiphilus jiangxiensis]SEL87049.1 hypothetical protein SAMN05414137_114146 [Streptacidiphilus jiangxiensis]
MTVGHDADNAVFHSFPDGTELCRFAVDRFVAQAGANEDASIGDEEDDDAHVAWSGGYLDSATAVITIAGETEDDEWSVPYVVDCPAERSEAAFLPTLGCAATAPGPPSTRTAG